MTPYDRAEARHAARFDTDPLYVPPEEPSVLPERRDYRPIALAMIIVVLAAALISAAASRPAPEPVSGTAAPAQSEAPSLPPGTDGASPSAPTADSGTVTSLAPRESSEPTGEIGEPLYVVRGELPDTATVERGTATFCAPTPKYCQSWGGTAMKGAVQSFRYGDTPYVVKVCRDDADDLPCVRVSVVSFCACGRTLIDLSPYAFRQLAGPRYRIIGRIRVTMTRGGNVVLPPTSTGD